MCQESKDSQAEALDLTHWLSYYRILVDDLKYAKNQQWHLAYYVTLLLAAIVTLSRTITQTSETTTILFMTSVMLGVAATYFLDRFQNDLTRYRKNIKRIREKFPPDLNEIARYEPAEGDPTYYIGFLYLLVAVIWVGVLFVGWAIGFWELLFHRCIVR